MRPANVTPAPEISRDPQAGIHHTGSGESRAADPRSNPPIEAAREPAGFIGQARPWLGAAALILCAALWSLNGPLIKLLAAAQVPGVTIACARSLVGGLVLLPFVIRHRAGLRQVRPPWLIASVTAFTLMTVSFVVATTQTAAASAIVLQYTAPIWVFLLSALLLKEPPRAADALLLALSMIGVAVMLAGGTVAETRWLLVALGSGLGYGALIVILRAIRSVHPLLVACMNCLGSGLILLIPAALTGTGSAGQRELWLVAALAIVQFTLPYALFSWGLRHVTAPQASLIVLLETVLNPLFTFLAIGEIVPAHTLAGGACIIGGVAVQILWGFRRARRRARCG